MQAAKRLIPVLLCKQGKVVKTRQFRKPKYVGDPTNTVLMFNEFEVDELIIQDIGAAKARSGPNVEMMSTVVKQCFMPLTYGGGIRGVEDARSILKLGIEKVSINTNFLRNATLAKSLSEEFGNQAIVASIDVKLDRQGVPRPWAHTTKSFSPKSLPDYVAELEQNGVGEFLFTSVDREGTWTGPNAESLTEATRNLRAPWIVHGGVSSSQEIENLLRNTSCSGVGVGSLFIYQQPGKGVLVGIPDKVSETMRSFRAG